MPFNRTKFFTTTMWSLVVINLIIQIYYWPHLPEQVAIHFNALGQADSWTTKKLFVLFNVGVLFFVSSLFQLMIYYFPKMPEELINIPHKKYWFSEAQRPQTIKRVTRYLLWISNLTILFLVGLSYLTVEANYYQTFKLAKIFWLLFGIYLLAFAFLTIELMIFFFRTPKRFK